MRNKLLTLVGALVIGALGSGLWELLKPMFVWASSASLSIVTLGLESLRDGLYEDVAKQNPERISAMLLSAVTGIITGIVVTLMTFPKNSFFKSPSAPATQSQEELSAHRKVLLSRIAALKRIKLVLAVFLVIALTWQFLLAQRVIYVSQANAHFNRLCTIAAPYLDERQLQKLRSSFSQISTRNEYIKLTGELEQVIRKNGARMPEFSTY